MDIKRKYKIEKTSFPLDGVYNYNVQVWLSIDNGKSYCYTGIGKFFKTKKEAKNYCFEYEKSHN